jgi:simple sugar transport system ATP-binding protein
LGRPLLELRDVTIPTYSLTVAGINLTVRSGEVLGLAGLEGSGQRLLLQGCAGLLRPARGQVLLDGQDITGGSYHRRRGAGVAYLAAGRLEEGLVAGLSLTEHLALVQPEHAFFVDWPAATGEMTRRIHDYQIIGRPDSMADELSGGNQQRLLFALMNASLRLVLLEHPTRGLDVRSMDTIWDLLYRRRDDGTAIVFMSADLDEILERSDRIAVFSGGVMLRIVDAAQTSVEELGHLIGGEV